MYPTAKSSLGVVFFPAYDWCISPTHPEREERLLYTQDQLREEGLFDIEGITEHKPIVSSIEDISRVHFCPPGFSSTVGFPHLVSAGSTLKAADLVLSGKKDKSFALTRPPGHHAMKVVQGSRGFCTINIEAVMVEYIRRTYGIKRIAIVDTDCHHGDGTQDIFWHDPDTLLINLHQDGRTLYPGTGFSYELGGPNALGTTINIPLPPHSGDEAFDYVARNLVRPLLDVWKPELVINSAGQDNHFTDPITDMCLTAQGYANMVEVINADIAVLEGGYSIQGALPYVNLAVILSMAGLDYSCVVEPSLLSQQVSTSAETMKYIQMLVESLSNVFFNREKLEHDYTLKNGWWTRERDIYYDTDGISEHQSELLRECSSCSGALIIETRTSFRATSLAVSVPRDCCSYCLNAAEDMVAQGRKKGMLVEYNNRIDDTYQRF